MIIICFHLICVYTIIVFSSIVITITDKLIIIYISNPYLVFKSFFLYLERIKLQSVFVAILCRPAPYLFTVISLNTQTSVSTTKTKTSRPNFRCSSCGRTTHHPFINRLWLKAAEVLHASRLTWSPTKIRQMHSKNINTLCLLYLHFFSDVLQERDR